MIKANPTRKGRLFWETFSALATRLCFREFSFNRDIEVDPDKSLLLMGNHISWWDGFWPLLLNKRYFKKEYHVMMLEEELKKRPFMSQGGAFSINPGHRSIVETIRYTASLLENPGNMVLMYPQGKIHSVYDTGFLFQPGLEKIHQLCKREFQTVFFAAMVDYGSFALPTLRMRLEEYHGDFSRQQLQDAYRGFYQKSLTQQLKEVPGEN